MEYKVKRFSTSRKAVSQIAQEAKSLLSKGLGPSSLEGKKFLLRSGHLSNSYGKIASKGKILNPGTWKKTSEAGKAQKEVGKIINDFYKGN